MPRSGLEGGGDLEKEHGSLDSVKWRFPSTAGVTFLVVVRERGQDRKRQVGRSGRGGSREAPLDGLESTMSIRNKE